MPAIDDGAASGPKPRLASGEPRPELHGLQGFLAGVLQREDAIVDDPALAERSREHVAGNDRLTPAEQVDIYRRQFWLRHRDSLLEDYPGLAYVIGEEAFDAFCRGYLAAHPPRTPSLRDLGADIIAFADRWEGFPADRRALALQMVRYENAFVDLFDGADPPPLDAAHVASLPEEAWERARIGLHPLLVLMRLDHPVHTLRVAARDGDEPEIPGPRSVCLALYRQDLVIRFEELDPLAFDLLEALRRGEPLVPACERIAATLDPAEADALGERVGPWFQRWTAQRWIVSVTP